MRRDPPILFDTIADEAEAYPLDAAKHAELVARVRHAAAHHEASIDWAAPLTLARDSVYAVCANASNRCRTL